MNRFRRHLVACVAAVGLTVASVVWAGTAWAGPALKIVDSDLDAAKLRIDQMAVLGNKLDGAARLVDASGGAFTLGERLGKPLLLVMSYYTCDGVCGTLNDEVMALLDGLDALDGLKAGPDFNVMTLSFDASDTAATQADFRDRLKPRSLGAGWTVARFADPTAIKPFTERMGYRFFWSAPDRMFLHPAAFYFLSAEGRVARVLYAADIEPKDVELAVLDAKGNQFRPSEVLNYAASLCFSFNYKEGRYVLSIPLMVGAGSLTFGVTAFSASAILYRRRRNRGGSPS